MALDTRLTPELVLEGQARDLVRFVQEARRGTSSPSPTVSASPSSPLRDVSAPPGHLRRLPPARDAGGSISVGPTPQQAHVAQAEIEGQPVILGLERPGPVRRD